MKLIASTFKGTRREGDWAWELQKGLRPKALYIFNDNCTDHSSAKRGGGNAVIRPWNAFGREFPPRSAGISTGDRGKGFGGLDDIQTSSHGRTARAEIDMCIGEIIELLKTGNYDTVVYSCMSEEDKTLGTGIFTVADDVRRYITQQITALVLVED
mgnify:CR=1 FL=1